VIFVYSFGLCECRQEGASNSIKQSGRPIETSEVGVALDGCTDANDAPNHCTIIAPY
jgi:hypothetical protein